MKKTLLKKTGLILACLMAGLSLVAPAQASIEPQASTTAAAATNDALMTPEDFYWRAYEEEQAQDYSHAIDDYTKAARKLYPLAQYRLGRMYYKGLGLSAPEYGLAYLYFQKAAAQGVTSAQNYMGNLYQNGYWVPRDFDRAMEWYNIAAEAGDDYATYNIGDLYEKGIGVDKDLDKAFYYYDWALRSFNAAALERLTALTEDSQSDYYGEVLDEGLVQNVKTLSLLEKQWPLSFAKCRKITQTEYGKKPSEAILAECRNTFFYFRQITGAKKDNESSFFTTELIDIMKTYYIAPVLYKTYTDQGVLSSNANADLAKTVSADIDQINKSIKLYGITSERLKPTYALYADAHIYKIHFLEGDKERDISLTNLTNDQALSAFAQILSSGLFELTIQNSPEFWQYSPCTSTTNVNLLLERNGIISGKIMVLKEINRSINPDIAKDIGLSLDFYSQTCLPLIIVEGEPFVIDFSNGMPRMLSWRAWYVQVMLTKRNAIFEWPYSQINQPMKYIYITDQHGHLPTATGPLENAEFYYASYHDEEISQVNNYNLEFCRFTLRKIKTGRPSGCSEAPFTTANFLKPN